MLGIGHVGAVSVLTEAGFRFERVAGTSAGSIVGALLAAGASTSHLRELIESVEYARFLDHDVLRRVPFVGPVLSVLRKDGYAEGRYLVEWLDRELRALGVRTFGDLRIDDRSADRRPEQRYRLVVMAADVTRGQLLRLPWDYERYELDPDRQPVVDAVRASISVPYLFEPVRLAHPRGESLLVDGGLLSNYPIDAFDRTDDRRPRWPTFGVTLLPQLPAAAGTLVPPLRVLGGLRQIRFLEALVTTTVVGRDQGYLAQPWVKARTIEVDTFGVSPFEFGIRPELVERLYGSGRRAATRFLDGWSFEDYVERYRGSAAA